MKPETKARLEAAMARIEDTPDGDLFAALDQAKDDADYFRDFSGRLEAEAIRRIKARDATMVVAGGLQAELKTSLTYNWNITALVRDIRPLITPAMWDECVEVIPPEPPKATYKFNTAKLNGLKKRLGPSAIPLIEAAAGATEKPPRVEITTAGGEADDAF